MKTTFTEAHVAESAHQIDRENGIIRHVKILGRVSKNGREYSPKAMAEARDLYEGVGVNLNHVRPGPDGRTPERRVEDGFGEFRGVAVESDGLFGDLHYNRKHREADKVAEDAERFPKQFGMSHDAEGDIVHRNGKDVVESITRVKSVDLVRNPATTKSFFESTEEPVKVKTTLQKIFEAAWPKRAKAVLQEDAGAMVADMPVEVPQDASADDQIKAAFRGAVVAAFDDEKLDTKATLKKIGEILKAYEKLQGGGEKKTDGGAEPPKKTEEGVDPAADPLKSLQESLAAMQRRELIRDLLEEQGLRRADVEPDRLKLLEKQPDEAAMRALIESWPPYQRQGRAGGAPRQPSKQELKESAVPAFKSPGDLAAFLRR